ncbi:flagellar hook-length control protein FliK [Bacillus carboniphilus]|uniref:Flagellar hook-length control protein FliK n=1 Tax=Bacillus carboniphilus TaxID=86663 RepID=A0ABY9JVV2_9BACI|nr:flagellar hook-length control protein FliK [Bacillus carboniphilus]WLR43537.1 flagellar hook-length control protein FliK [Bacillus carboniphilus]
MNVDIGKELSILKKIVSEESGQKFIDKKQYPTITKVVFLSQLANLINNVELKIMDKLGLFNEKNIVKHPLLQKMNPGELLKIKGQQKVDNTVLSNFPEPFTKGSLHDPKMKVNGFDRLLSSAQQSNKELNQLITFPFSTNQLDSPQVTSDGSKKGELNSYRFMDQILIAIKKGNFNHHPNGTSRLVLKLTPEHLGTITISIVEKEGQRMAKLIANSQSAKELLDTNIQSLQRNLPHFSIHIDRFEIGEQFNSSFIKEDGQEKEREQQADEEAEDQEEANDISFTDQLFNMIQSRL